jgi:hypothetical protein
MKRLTIAAASLLLLAACTHGPTNPGPPYSEPFGTVTLSVGPDASAILNAGNDAIVPALVAAALAEQQACDLEKMAEEAADLIVEENPEIIEVTQTRILPVTSTLAGRNIPSAGGCPDFALLLGEILQSKGKFFNVTQLQPKVDCIVPMAVEGSGDVEMRLTVTEALLARPTWIP